MTAKEYLNRVRKQNYVVRQAEKELTMVKSDILSLKAASLSEKVSGTKESDLADKYIKLEKYFDRVIAEWDALIDMRIEAKAMIAMLPDEAQLLKMAARPRNEMYRFIYIAYSIRMLLCLFFFPFDSSSFMLYPTNTSWLPLVAFCMADVE